MTSRGTQATGSRRFGPGLRRRTIVKKLKKIKKTETPTEAPKAEVKQPETKATTKTEAKAKTDKPVKASINKGKTTGMRIMEYQDSTLAKNGKTKLSDEAMAKNWREEFPNARCQFTAEIVAGVRRLFNAGKHGSQKISAPDGGVKRYDENGAVIPERQRKAKAKAESVAA
jgi:hypothetical protein